MEEIAILTDKSHSKFNEILIKSIKEKYKDINVIDEGYIIKLSYNKIKNKNKFYEFVSNIISNYIIDNFYKNLIQNIVEEDCYDFELEEIEKINEKVMNEIIKDLNIKLEIFELIKNRKCFNLNGFLLFRCKNKEYELEEKIFNEIDNYFYSQEMDSFLQLVQKFIFVQIPKIDYVHIISKEDDYIIITNEGEEVDLDELSNEIKENIKGVNIEINTIDLLISCLISLLPKKIYLHFDENSDNEPLELLAKIYENKHHICHSCEICELIKSEK